MIPVIIIVAVLVFTIMYFCPGDPAAVILGSYASDADIALKRAEMGFDDSYLVQLGRFLYNFLIRFDLGRSYITQQSVFSEIMNRFPRTLLFSITCIIFNVIVGIPLGMTAAVHQNRLLDRISMTLALIGISLPSFWVALELVILFSLKLGWLPAYGIGGPQYYILPVIAGSLDGIAQQARQTRSSMLEVIRSDYVTTARSKGLTENKILYIHALPNALIPVIQTLGNMFARSLGGALIIENVFSIPGIGTYLSTGIAHRDYPIVQGCVVFLALVFGLIMLLVDVSFAFVDPRIKSQYEKQGNQKKIKEAA
jgi:peptide/nickel transport system permease protein